jgi:hypothetical protein
MVEGRIDDAQRHAVGDLGAQGGFAGAARQQHPVAIAHAALFGVVRMDFKLVLGMPITVIFRNTTRPSGVS